MRLVKRIVISIIFILFAWIILARFVICQNRWSDSKALGVFESRKIDLRLFDTVISNRHIHYAVTGSDTLPTLIFIHGSPGSWMNYWRFMLDSSLRTKFRMVSIDRPGFGKSNYGEALHLTDQCNLILPVLTGLSNKKAMILFGHSMGGPIAIQLSAMKPDLFDRVFVVAGALDPKQEATEEWRHIMSTRPLCYLLPGAFHPSNTELLYLKKELPVLASEFAKITASVSFIHGTADTWVPIENVAYGIQQLKNAKSISADTLIGADHQLPWKNQDELIEIILNRTR